MKKKDWERSLQKIISIDKVFDYKDDFEDDFLEGNDEFEEDFSEEDSLV